MAPSVWCYESERPAAGDQTPLADPIVVGREGADVLLEDPEVSRRHARLIPVENGDLVVEDLDSSNGTWVNGERVEGRRSLVEGDRVRFGETVWRIGRRAQATRIVDRSPPADASATPAPVPDHRRGEVPAPEAVPSVVRRRLPATPDPTRAFAAPEAPRHGRSAARRLDVTLACYCVILLTAAALIVYFATR